MLVRYLLAGVAGSALMASVAFAQTPSATTDTTTKSSTATSSMSDTTAASHQGEWRASKVVGVNVYNDNNESVGSINDLLMDKSGSIKAVVIGVGGFLGVGEHLVAVPFDKIKFSDQPVAYTGTASNAGGAKPATSSSSTTTGTATTTSASTTKSNPWYPDHAVFNTTKDELKAMPEFKYSNQ
jgi:sporulation protein YlmC with PRC-barrel domain